MADAVNTDTTPRAQTIAHAAHTLIEARRQRTPASAAAIELPDADAAYAVQDAVAEAFGWFARGVPAHWKSGGASRGVVLTHAALPDAGVWHSPADLREAPLRLRGIEAEIALRLGRDVDAALAATLDVDAARALVDAMCVSIEIVDSRWREGVDAPPLAKLADLQTHGALVLGAWVPFSPRDWAALVCRVRIGERAIDERRGTHALADPCFVLPAWLRHATRGGAPLPAGTVVTTGTWCGILNAEAGDLVVTEFPGIGSARVLL